MKKIPFLSVLALVLLVSLPTAYAQNGGGQGGSSNSNGSGGNPTPTLYGEQEKEQEREQEHSEDNGPGSEDAMEQEREQEREMEHNVTSNSTGLQKQERHMVRATSTEDLKYMLQERRQEQEQSEEGLGEEEREMVRSQNRSELATEALTMAGNFYGDRSEEMQNLVEEFKASQERAHTSEKEASERGVLHRFLFGGDKKAASGLYAEVEQNKERIQEMNQLIEECDCEEPLQATLNEQLQLMQEEQNRLNSIALREESRRGVFGFLFGWMD